MVCIVVGEDSLHVVLNKYSLLPMLSNLKSTILFFAAAAVCLSILGKGDEKWVYSISCVFVCE